ncbi:flagellar hook-length control protein FliK [Paenibacillus phyllosphaerae]|uniref:Flagellar hook-length control protein FliK n=1 Tax=Paenibacillus phyllosphaerae TaxID=274593 RepID=A0A7W5FLW5_9BACL|nr:flagellar hook-length control protein FliK [Paenibacillus phyllosphaerae]MBB3109394.1 flagellar hook-length control protein FliK [Paenibacillus phyllosphaerae]
MQIAAMNLATQNTSQPSTSNTGSTKGTEGAFGQALDQSISGTATTGEQAQNAGAMTADQTQVQATVQKIMASMMAGETPSSEELISIVDSLLESLTNVDTEGEEEALSGERLDESLSQLDSLLAILENIPVLQSFVSQQQQQEVTATATGDNTAIGALQGMLQDLRAVLQQDKTGAISKDMMKEIGKQVGKLDQLINGGNQTDPNTAAVQGEIETGNASNAPAANTHLNRLSAQLLHAGILNVVPTEEQAVSAESTPVEGELAVDADQAGIQTHTVIHDSTSRPETNAKVVVQQPVPVQKFAETMKDMMVKQFNVNTVGGIHEATLSLAPAHLGQVDVRISVHNGQLTALFVAESASAKEMLDNQMSQLRSSLQAQGLQVEKIEVTQSSAAFESNMFHKGNGGQQSRDQQSSKRGGSFEQSIGEIGNFEADMEQLAVERAVTRTLGYGREINTTA